MKRIYSLLAMCLFLAQAALAQPMEQLIKVVVAPDHTDWTYRPGEKVQFSIMVLENGNPVKGAKVSYEIGPEKMTPTIKQTVTAKDGTLKVDGGTMKEAGFLRCIVTAEVDGRSYRKLATAGFAPGDIKPTVTLPSDFAAFWDKGKAELAKVPMDARLTLMPERCTEKVNVYHANIQGYGNSRLYGILCVPKKPGKYPAILRVPGAGIRPYGGDIANAEQGFITLEIGIHGIPVNLDPSLYTSLASGALYGYPSFNLNDKDKYYYKRVYLNCVRANDFLTSLPEYDGQHLGVMGGSQGGALSIVTAGLDKRVTALAALYPALCDVTGYMHNRAGGWPHLFRDGNPDPKEVATAGYYDVVNFAKAVKIPGKYTWGFNDETCPPTSMHAAYNSITAPKSLYLLLEGGHTVWNVQYDELGTWLRAQLKG
ncbi:acetylxylan esterase [Chitinophaga lutea]